MDTMFFDHIYLPFPLLGDSLLSLAISETSSILLAGPKLSSCSQTPESTPILLLQVFHVCVLTSNGCKKGVLPLSHYLTKACK